MRESRNFSPRAHGFLNELRSKLISFRLKKQEKTGSSPGRRESMDGHIVMQSATVSNGQPMQVGSPEKYVGNLTIVPRLGSELGIASYSDLGAQSPAKVAKQLQQIMDLV